MTDLATTSPPCDLEAAGHFLETATAGLPDGMYLHLWCLPKKTSKWFTCRDLAGALKWAGERTAEGQNVYVGAAFCDRDLGPDQRTRSKEEPNVAGMVGLIADVDFQGTGKKKQYPPDEAAVLALLERCPLAPTVIVHSGHGLQAWWLFPEPWMFGDAGELAAADALAKAWGKHLQALAEPFALDSTFDLARVLRLPGTVNFKDPKAPVRIVSNSGPRHTHETFRAHLPAVAQGTLTNGPDRDAEKRDRKPETTAPVATDFPDVKHEGCLANSDKYAATWERTRPDQKDTSPSGWDMTLANLCVQAGMTAGETTAVLIRYRSKHNEEAKPQSYYKLTVGKALEAVSHEHVFEGRAEPADRQEAVAALAHGLNIPLTRIQRITGAEDRWRFTISGQVAELTVAATSNRTSFENSVWTKCGKVPRTPKKADDWRRCRELMWAAAEVIDAGDEASLDGELRSWLAAYLAGNRPVELGPGELVEYAGHPFLRDGRVWFKLTELLRYLHVSLGVKITQGLLCQRLVAVGAIQSNAIRVKDGKNKPKQGRYWAVTWATDDAEEADDAEE